MSDGFIHRRAHILSGERWRVFETKSRTMHDLLLVVQSTLIRSLMLI